jgi:hypothetical protein
MNKKWLFTAAAAVALAIPAFGLVATNAQSPATPPATPDASGKPAQPMFGRGMDIQALLSVRACSTTDYTDVAAKALGMTASDLRVALVSGKSLSDLETAQKVSADTVQKALTDTEKADVAQAVKDGVITQAQADFITSLLDKMPSTMPRQGGPFGGNRGPFPGGRMMGGMFLGISPYNTVNNYAVVTEAIGVKCADLVVAVLQGRQSIADFATSKNVQPQTVIDALVKAHTDALDQDVKEGLITVAEKDGQVARLPDEMKAFVNGARARFLGQPGQPCQPGNDGNGQGNDQGNGNPTMPCPPNHPGSAGTPPATPSGNS